MLNFAKKTLILLMIVLILSLSACLKGEDEKNEAPLISVGKEVNYLQVNISGSALDNDGFIKEISINWGDESSDKIESNFDNFEKIHSYSIEGVYAIEIKAEDDKNEIKTVSLTVSVEKNENIIEGIKESMYKNADNEFLIMTLNMHTYQERNQEEKFNMIVDLIGKMDVDFVTLQENAQNKDSEILSGIIREDNMSYILVSKLKETYNKDYTYTWDWAHYGWDEWEEGVAVLSKYEIRDYTSRYVSSSTTTSNITSRKVVYGSYEIDNIGAVNIVSAHTHWRTSETSEEQNNQIKNIKAMIDEKESGITDKDVFSFVAGDFNGNPTSDAPWSEGYQTMVEDNIYVDTFLEAYPEANTIPAQSEYDTVKGDYPGRIDYIFMKNNEKFEVIDSQIIFTPAIIGEVSDHYGVITKIRYKN